MKRLMILIFIIVSFLAGCAPSENSSASQGVLSEAGAAYQDGAYDKAMALYEKVLAEGLQGGALYYNLGNAYLKKGRVGKAILNYTRAGHFTPRDSELIANYSQARKLMRQPDPKPRASMFVQELSRLFDIFTVGEAVGIFFFTYYLLTALIIITILVKRQRILMSMLALILTASLTLIAIPVFDKLYEAERGAIAVSPVIYVKKEPYDDASVGFPLYDGMKVYIMKEGVGWVKIQRPDGRVGWVNMAGIEKIQP